MLFSRAAALCVALVGTSAALVAVPRSARASISRRGAAALDDGSDDGAVDPQVIVDVAPDAARRGRLSAFDAEELSGPPVVDATVVEAPAKKPSLLARVGESGALSYVGINVVWYSIGVNVFLYSMPLASSKAGGGLRLALKRFGAAWGLCFVASQWSAGLRAGLAAALAPTTSKGLAALRRRLPSAAPRWVAPLLGLGLLVSLFCANAAAVLLREVVRVGLA